MFTRDRTASPHRHAEDVACLSEGRRDPPAPLDKSDRIAQQLGVARLSRPGVIFPPDTHVPTPADRRLGQPAPHNVTAKHRDRPRQPGRREQLQVRLQRSLRRRQAELEGAAEVQLDSAPGGISPSRCQTSAVRRKPGSKIEMLGAARSSAHRANMYATSA